MYQNKLNRSWNPCKICKWGCDKITQEEFNEHCEKCNDLASEFEESNEFKQFQIGVAISKTAKKIEEAQERNKVYPILIICTSDVKSKLLEINREEANQNGLNIIDIKTTEDLEKYIGRLFYWVTPVFIIKDCIEVRDFVYSKKEIMDNWKVFTCFPNFNNTKYNLNSDPVIDTYRVTKKDILNLKLDRRFDQIALESYTNLGYNLFVTGSII